MEETKIGVQYTSDKMKSQVEMFEAIDSKDPEGARRKILQAVEDLRSRTSHQRWLFERGWFRNLLYYAGNQWVTFDRSSRTFRERRLRKWVPKSVTNRFASTANSIAAAIENIKPDVSYRPSSTDPDDIATAGVCEKLTPVIDHETDVKTIKARLAKWTTLTGNAYASPGYDLNWDRGSRFVQDMMCQACGTVVAPEELDVIAKCPECGSPYLQDAVDQSGQPLGKEIPVGQMIVDVLSPFEVFLDIQIEGVKKQFQIMTSRTFDLDTIKRTWQPSFEVSEQLAGQDVKESYEYRNAIAYITDVSSYTTGQGGDKIPRATVHRLDRLPDEDFPEGVQVVVVGEDVLEVSRLPYTHLIDGRDVPFLPYVQFGYESFPGRHYHKTPCDDLIPKQDQRNRIESLIELTIMRGAYNTWLLPLGSGITNLSGEPGQKVHWDPNATNGASPSLVSSNPVPPALPSWIEKIDSDFEELAGTFDVLKGNVPKGVSAGYAIQLLTERGFSRFGSVFSNWETAWREVRKQELSIFRTYATEERIRTIMGQHGEWETQKFMGSDLMGGVNIVIESGEARPKSQLAMQASIEQLLKLGILDPNSAEQKYRIAEKYGLASVMGGVDVDMQAAAKEFQAFLNGTEPRVNVWIDNAEVHMAQHRQDGKTDAFQQLPDKYRKVWSQHIMKHAMAIVMQSMQVQSALGIVPEPAGAPSKPRPKGGPGSAEPKGDKAPSPLSQIDQTNNIMRSKS